MLVRFIESSSIKKLNKTTYFDIIPLDWSTYCSEQIVEMLNNNLVHWIYFVIIAAFQFKDVLQNGITNVPFFIGDNLKKSIIRI